MAERIEWRAATLRGTQDLTDDIRLFAIAPAEFRAPSPGSHVHVAVQIGERPDVRSYSVIGGSPDGLYRIAVKRLAESRGGSDYMWRLPVGARLTISGPRNHFELARGRPQYLLVAGGIGITPIHSMALALHEAGADLRVLYAARRRRDLAFADELEARLGDRVQTFADQDGRRIDFDREIDALHPQGEVYVCGPIGMLDGAKRAWARSGRPVDRLRFETFGNSGRLPTLPFAVNIPRLGLAIQVPSNRTLLEALEEAGVAMIHDCRRGECGLCALPILGLDGPIDHRDVFFSDDEKAGNAKLCTCVSRVAGGSITLDTPDRAAVAAS